MSYNKVSQNDVGPEDLLTFQDEIVEEKVSSWSIDRIDVSTSGDGTLPSDFIAEAEFDLHEKKEWIDRDVQALRDMVLSEPGLNSKTDKAFLLSFLRARKFDYEKAMMMIRGYYRVRYENKEIFSALLPSNLHHIWKLNIQTILHRPDYKGRTILIFSTENWNPDIINLDDIFKAQMLLLEHIVQLPITQLKGITAIVDCTGLSFNHAYNLTPLHIKRMVSVIQEVFPLRFKALHFVHEPSIFTYIFSLIKPFLSDTIKGRLHFHGENFSDLHEEIPIEILPLNLGGSSGPLDNSDIVEAMLKNEEYYKEHFSYGFSADEMNIMTESPSQGSVLDTVAGMGSLLGSYYRKMCIE